MILYLVRDDKGNLKFTTKPTASTYIEKAEWELPKGISYGNNEEGKEGFIYNDYWWRPANHLHTVKMENEVIPYIVFLDYADTCFKAYLFNKRGEPEREPEKMVEEAFICGECGMDVSLNWNRKMFGNVLHCPHCGKMILIE